MSKDAKKQAESNILTFLRIRPSKKPSGYFSQDELEPNSLNFLLPDNVKAEYINNTKTKYSFHFNGILPMNATQEEVFKKVGQVAVQNAMDGFNSTIFAYGQTGSGKTFTITGGAERYEDRGIIPRAISMIFREFKSKPNVQLKAYISYLELYNEQGYDLLDPSHDTKALEDLPKVTILEDEAGNFHLKNLGLHPAETEEDALELLFRGDTNRAVAETPMNLASSRSHCIFTISMEVREVGSDAIRRSKLHLVDLAGSERVSKTNSSGSVLSEAKYINTSLFFLEMVIVALYEKATKGRQHVPYRNSMMTSVLRDSLGGNCKTIMIATINPEAPQTEESLSTCRFAQRVSLIKNRATVNEGLDPEQIIKRLKAEILSLREEITFLKGEAGEGDNLTPAELEDLHQRCRQYCDDPDPNSILNIGEMTLTKIKNIYAIFKMLVLEARKNASFAPKALEDDASPETGDYLRQIKDLKSSLLQRDNEIAILVNMVKKAKANVVEAPEQYGIIPEQQEEEARDMELASRREAKTLPPKAESKKGPVRGYDEMKEKRTERIIQRHLFGVPPPEDKSIFDDMSACFEYFRTNCELKEAIDRNKEVLKQKMAEAQMHGEKANQSRNTINYLKTSIESIRRERAIQSLDATGTEEKAEETEEEAAYRRAIEQEKNVYRDSFEKLRILKPEIEHIRKMLEKSRATLQSQFDQWHSNLMARGGTLNADRASDAKYVAPLPIKQASMETKLDAKGARGRPGPMVVEDEEVNEDIMAFYKAKDELLKRRSGNA